MILSAKKGEGIGKRKRKEKYDYTAFIWLAPALIMMLIFCYYPPIYAAVLSFTASTGGDTFNFIFFDNYIEIFSDRIFWLGMRNVVVFLIWGLISGNVAPLLLAELLFNTKSVKLSNTLRFLFIIPTLIPGVINMILWQFIILGPEPTSIMNSLIGLFGADPLAWYYDYSHTPWITWFSLMFTGFPYLGGTSFLIYLAGLQAIPESVIEAAKLDGCTGFGRVCRIDLPFLLGQIKYFLIMGVIGGLQGFGMQMLFTGHGPENAATVPGFYMYNAAFGGYDRSRYGYASAVGMIIFVITLTLTIVNMKFINKKEDA